MRSKDKIFALKIRLKNILLYKLNNEKNSNIFLQKKLNSQLQKITKKPIKNSNIFK